MNGYPSIQVVYICMKVYTYSIKMLIPFHLYKSKFIYICVIRTEETQENANTILNSI